MSAVRRRRASRGSGEQLRVEIVAAAKDLLAETGSAEGMSIRAVAERVGVTSPSIYLHFADKDQLLDAVVSDVFAQLDSAILAAVHDLPDDQPLERLRAQGMAYIHFALDHREHYRVAAMEPCLTPPNVDTVIRGGAFAHFTETVEACQASGLFPAGDALSIALDLWTAAHGVAALVIAKPYLPWGDIDVIGNRALGAAALGHAVAGLIGPDATPSEMAEWIAAQRAGSRAGRR